MTAEDVLDKFAGPIASAVVGAAVSLLVATRALLKRHKEHGDAIARLTVAQDAMLIAINKVRTDHDGDLDELEELIKVVEKDMREVREKLTERIHELSDSSHDMAERAELANFMTRVNEWLLKMAEQMGTLHALVTTMEHERRSLPTKR